MRKLLFIIWVIISLIFISFTLNAQSQGTGYQSSAIQSHPQFKSSLVQGLFGSQQVISTNARGASSVFAIDLDSDGDADIISASPGDDKIAWYENDGAGGFGPQQIITTEAEGANSVFAADLDGDGDPDVVSTSVWIENKIAWYENDGAGGFGPQQIITTEAEGVNSVFAADLDGDGDADIISASMGDDKIAWYENDGAGSFGPQQVISTDADTPLSVFVIDLNGDSYHDVLSASIDDDKIAWYENDGTGGFGPQQVISTDADGAESVFAADIDGDGDPDVISASSNDDKIAWYENDGTGGFGSQQVISTVVQGARFVFAADLDGDGDPDVVSASNGLDDEIAWHENDGAGGFGPQQVISTEANKPMSVYAADLDGDGDADLVSASNDDSKIAWYENHAVTTSLKDELVPDDYSLSQNHPNPFNPSTTISYSLPESGKVTMTVVTMLGQNVVTLVDDDKAAGRHTVTFNASNFSSGTYLILFKAKNYTETRKMTLIK